MNSPNVSECFLRRESIHKLQVVDEAAVALSGLRTSEKNSICLAPSGDLQRLRVQEIRIGQLGKVQKVQEEPAK
jgi:hypothetical protein